MNHKIVRESIPFKASKKQTSKWKRKRPTFEESDKDIGLQPYPIKSRKQNWLSYKEKPSTSSEGMNKSSNILSRFQPLTDITYLSREPQYPSDQSIAMETDHQTRIRLSSSLPETTEPEVAYPSLKKSRAAKEPGPEIVTYVNNLFSPVNKLHAIPMSLGELQRRMEYPEHFGRRELVSYLRHSKTTGNEIIAKYDLKPGTFRPRLNVLSRLCESEANTLANGIYKMNNEYFPVSHVADTMKGHMRNDKMLEGPSRTENVQIRNEDESKETVSTTIDILHNLKHLLTNPTEDVVEDLGVFDKVTHTFGCQNLINHISFFQTCLEELKKKL